MTCEDDHDPTDGPPDPQLDPAKSPGWGDAPAIEDIDVGRDVTLGEADLAELMASDTAPVEDHPDHDLLAALADGPVVERRRAELALADRDASEAVVVGLAQAVARDDDPEVRQFAVEALGRLGGGTAEEVALAASHDDEPWVRAEAVVSLDRLDRDGHADRIEAALADDHHAVRRNALISVFKRRGEGALDHLLAAADDDSERVREWAAHMLGGVDDDRARRTLEALAESDDSGLVRATAANAREADPDRFRRDFVGALADRDVVLPGEDLLNRQPRL